MFSFATSQHWLLSCITHLINSVAIVLDFDFFYDKQTKFVNFYQEHSGICSHIHCRPKLWNILKPNGNTRNWHFDLLEMAWHQPQPSIVT